jgi:hypothetical protein
MLNPLSLIEGFTQSEITTMDDCAEKWHNGYNLMLRRKGAFQWYNIYGTCIHKGLEDFYRDGTEAVPALILPEDAMLDANQEAEFEYWSEVAALQLPKYYKYNKLDLTVFEIIQTEEIITVDYEGIRLTGKLDMMFKDSEGRITLCDHKTTGRWSPDVVNGWHWRFQFMFYMWLAERRHGIKVEGFMVNCIVKPALKQGKAESLPSFIARVQADMTQEPDKYFKRIWMPTLKNAMKRFEDEMLRPKIHRLQLLTQEDTDVSILELLMHNKNTNNCIKFGQNCEFLPLCQNGHKLESFQYTQKTTKHEELTTD